MVEKIARCVLRGRIGGYNQVCLSVVDGAEVDSVLFWIAPGVIRCEENKMFAVRKNRGQRWVSCFVLSSRVAGVGVPPCPLTLTSAF